jgi:hypothetical protein
VGLQRALQGGDGMTAIGTIVTLMTRVLGHVFGGDSWATWRALLQAVGGEPLSDNELALVTPITGGRTDFERIREIWKICGRRAGKSIIAALLAVWLTTCRQYTLAPGEVGVLMVISATRRQTRVIKRYISGLLRSHPSLEALVERETEEAIWLTNGLCIECHVCSYKSIRGYTVIGAICDEVAFWDVEGSANPDTEVLTALRAAMTSVPESLLICLTTPYRRAGEVWKTYQKHFGRNDSSVLVVQAASRALNPTLSEDLINEAVAEDPAAAAAEYLADFRKDIEALLSPELLDSVVIPGRVELPPSGGISYLAFFDGAGGSSAVGDSATQAIGHLEGERVVVDFVREVRPPFSPEAVISLFAEDCRRYRVSTVIGDRFAGEWPTDAYRKQGLTYRTADLAKSGLYRELLPLIASGRVELLDLPVLRKQLLGLERRVSRSGQELIDHPPGRGVSAHDDVANAVAGVCYAVAGRGNRPTVAVIHTPGVTPGRSHPEWQDRFWGRPSKTGPASQAMRDLRAAKSAQRAAEANELHEGRNAWRKAHGLPPLNNT